MLAMEESMLILTTVQEEECRGGEQCLPDDPRCSRVPRVPATPCLVIPAVLLSPPLPAAAPPLPLSLSAVTLKGAKLTIQHEQNKTTGDKSIIQPTQIICQGTTIHQHHGQDGDLHPPPRYIHHSGPSGVMASLTSAGNAVEKTKLPLEMSGRKQTDQGSLSPSDCRKAYRAERKAVTLYHLLGRYRFQRNSSEEICQPSDGISGRDQKEMANLEYQIPPASLSPMLCEFHELPFLLPSAKMICQHGDIVTRETLPTGRDFVTKEDVDDKEGDEEEE
ncbi:uncharacterized protein GJ701_001722 [Geothlypis trichas]